MILSHRACPECGQYRGRSVIVMEVAKEKKDAKGKPIKSKAKKAEQEPPDKPLTIENLSKKQ